MSVKEIEKTGSVARAELPSETPNKVRLMKRKKVMIGCCIACVILVIGGIVTCFVGLGVLNHMFRHTLRIENRSSQKIDELNVLWPNGTYSIVRYLGVGDSVSLTYYPNEDGHSRLLYYVTDNGCSLVRYVNVGSYMTSCVRSGEEWIIHDDDIETYTGVNGRKHGPNHVKLLFKQ